MALQAVLFDLDGTLIDSLPLILYASKLTYEQMGLTYDEKYLRSTIGLPIVSTAAAIAGDKAEEYLEIYSELCHKYQNQLIKVYPHVKRMLKGLQDKGTKIALVTARRRFSVDSIFQNLNLTEYFSTIICAEDTVKHKPDPEPALVALKNMGVAAQNAVMVGDSPYDVGCGKAAGCTAAGVTWGMADAETLEAAGPHSIFNKVSDLSAWLFSL